MPEVRRQIVNSLMVEKWFSTHKASQLPYHGPLPDSSILGRTDRECHTSSENRVRMILSIVSRIRKMLPMSKADPMSGGSMYPHSIGSRTL